MKRKLTLEDKKIISDFMDRNGIAKDSTAHLEKAKKIALKGFGKFRYNKLDDRTKDVQYREFLEGELQAVLG